MTPMTFARKRIRQTGTTAVEFSLLVLVLLTFVFATLEMARAEFMLNTLREVTRRAAASAANVSFQDASKLQSVQSDAVLRNAPGPLILGEPVTSDNVKIDYLSVSKNTFALNHVTTLPACPASNRMNCLTDPYADNCIRFVRARVCASMDGSGNCQPLSYQMLFPFFDLSSMDVPSLETIVPAGSLGYTVGSMPCS